jgi:glycosyltransferase involved in cell wall biosynthesis
MVKTQDPRGLANAITTVLSDPALAAQFGAEARRWVVADFQPDSVVRTLLAFGEGATNDAPGAERGAGHMTSGV